MADEFYNPYHFVPLEDLSTIEQLPLDAAGFRADGPDEGCSHASYRADRLHGRIVCRLVPETPLAIGAGQDKLRGDDDYTFVEPYMLHEPSRLCAYPALPASSLKGLISSLAETASASALRVLTDTKPVSWRVPPGGALSALGLLAEEEGKLRLRPLTAPTIDLDRPNGFAKWHLLFDGQVPLKVVFGEYPEIEPRKRDHSIAKFEKSLNGHESTKATVARGGSGKASFYASVNYLVEFGQNGRPTEKVHLYHPSNKDHPGGDDRFICGQIASNAKGGRSKKPLFLSEKQWEDLKDKGGFIRGFVRVLGGEGRDMADTKKHEVFIPYPKEAESRKTLRVSDSALATFRALADERTLSQRPREQTPNSWLPYTPFRNGGGCLDDRKETRHRGDIYHTVELKDGQIVYFDIEKDGEEIVVSAISFSSIWRGLVKNGEKPDAHIASMRDFFPKELRPMSAKRDTISPAEWLFGFVSEDEQPDPKKGIGHVAYRGRVRFSAGRLAKLPDDPDELFMQGDYGDGSKYIRLRELSSPKPPSPAMYFRPRNGTTPVRKHELRISDQPQGRKLYLHQGRREGGRTIDTQNHPWATRHENDGKNRKLAVRLLDKGKVAAHGGFWFHLDFDNLTEEELDLLCYALQPGGDFHHKLGLGKPLGLGTVQIEPVALLLVDRKERYRDTDPFGASRWHGGWLSAQAPIDDLKRRYLSEADAAQRVAVGQGVADIGCHERAKRHAAWMAQRLPATKQALDLLGNPKKLDADTLVHTPLAPGQTDPEKETYKWFAGKNGPPMALEPITGSTKAMRKLRRS